MNATQFLQLFHYLNLRAARREPGRTALTMLGVALGVAVVVAIRLGNANTINSFKDSVDSIAGQATVQVRGNVAPLDERLLARVALHPGVEGALPVIEQTVSLENHKEQDLTIMGVDLLTDQTARAYAYASASPDAATGVKAVLSVLPDPRGIFLTERFATEIGINTGDELNLLVDDRVEPVRVHHLLKPVGPARAYSGRIAVMDMAAAQHVLKRYGQLDRIDVIPDSSSTSPEELIESLKSICPPGVIIERPGDVGERAEAMMAAFRMNCNALSGVALLVGAFLIYNSVSISVVRRRQEIGTFRSLGASRGSIRSVFLAEGAILGFVSSVLGVLLGYALARTVVRLVSRAVAYHYVRTEAVEAELVPMELAIALVLGTALAILAALGPAIEASRTAPANVTRRGSGEGVRRRRMSWRLLQGAVTLALAAAAWHLPPIGDVPFFGFVSGALILCGFAFITQPAVELFNGLLKRLSGGAEAILATSSIAGSPGRSAVAVCGLMVGLSLVGSIGVMTRSFRETVDLWLLQTMRADLYLAPPTQGESGRLASLDVGICGLLGGIPEVEAVDCFSGRDIVFGDRRITVGGADLAVFAKYSDLRFVEGELAPIIRECIDEERVLVSEPLANHLRLKRGDPIDIPCVSGTFRTTVAGVYYEYSSTLGYVTMDRTLYQRLFPGPDLSSVGIYVRKGADVEAVMADIRRRLESTHQVRIYGNGELRQEALRVFDETFRVTSALQIIAIIVSILGVATTLLAVITDRRDEIVTLRFLGARRGRVARVVLYESAILGFTGSVLGSIAGVLLAQLLIFVINKQSFGWTIQFYPPYGLILGLALLVFAATLVSGYFPARRAARMEVRYEKVMG